MRLPTALTLPSGLRVALAARSTPSQRKRAEGAPLFSEVLALFDEGAVRIDQDVRDLLLADFHVLRAVLTKFGFLHEEEIEVPCANCRRNVAVKPCASLEIGPWVDGELGDEILDTLAPFGQELEIVPVDERATIVLGQRKVREVLPLFEALAKPKLDVDASFVRALGIEALGAEKNPEKIAEVLSACTDDEFGSVTDAYLDTCYPMRLGGIARCPRCKARNDVDAPYEREFAPSPRAREDDRESSFSAVPDFDTFAIRAEEIAAPYLKEVPGEPVELVVEGGTPAVDDGGEPLLGSYVPPHPGDLGSPTRPPTVTIYWRTFRTMEDDEGRYDWEKELEETIEHELEHHVYFLRGDDPMDAAEHDEIDREVLRVVGRREAGRRVAADFGDSVRDFAVRTWPLWVIAAIALAFALFND